MDKKFMMQTGPAGGVMMSEKLHILDNDALQRHALSLMGQDGGQRLVAAPDVVINTDLRGANLRGAALIRVDLSGVDLRRANLSDADLRDADLRGAELRRANLSDADLRDADLRGANLNDAELRGANLRGADLRGAKLDFACWPLWCGSQGAVVDARIAAQLAAHFCALTCDDPAYQEARAALLPFARTSHRAQDLGLIDEEDRHD